MSLTYQKIVVLYKNCELLPGSPRCAREDVVVKRMVLLRVIPHYLVILVVYTTAYTAHTVTTC